MTTQQAVSHSAPLMETKLLPPGRRAGLVARPELVERLEAASAHKLTLVSAPAGWGKTTLLGDWLASRDGARSGWVALDQGDNDPTRFWRYLTEAIRRAGASVDDEAASALIAPGDEQDRLLPLVNALAALDEPATIALDDFHAIREPEIHAAMAFLIERLPPGLRLVLATRSEPPIGLPRLRARGELAELRSADLRFSRAEAGALLGEAIGLALDGDEVERLRRRTEGWAAGLYLAGLSLRGREDAADFIRDFSGDDRLVVDYLASEVLERQPPERREFLLRTSILTRLSGPLCDAVTGRRDSARLLAELERSNLFMVPLDNRRQWYRYHHLFGGLLQHELELTMPGETTELHRRASAWHRRDGEVDEAINHAAAAGDLEDAADLISAVWLQTHRSGSITITERWLALLPEEMVLARPKLCLARAWTMINLGRPDAAAEAIAAAEAAIGPGPAPPDIEANVAMARSVVALLVGDLDVALAAGQRAIELAPGPDDPWRAAACLSLGMALCHREERPDEAYRLLAEAVETALRTGTEVPALVAYGHMAMIDLDRGDLDLAEGHVRSALELAATENHASFPHAAGAHAGLARVLIERGRPEEALEQAEIGLRLARRGRAAAEIAHNVQVLVQARLANGDVEGARAALRELRPLVESLPSPGKCGSGLIALEEALRAGRPAGPSAVAADELSERELAVLRLLGGIASAREIADQLYVSHNTVKTQVRSIYRKLGVASRAEAVARARSLGLLGGRPADLSA